MGSKVIVFLVLFLATVFLISSEVAARELEETSNTVDTSLINTAKETNGEVNDAKYPGGGYGGYPGGGYGGGRGGYGRGRGGYCRYGCCGRSYYRGGCRCCTYAGEKADAEPQN
ncbi:hypothetical protein DH2020_014473 [Rehmannia glutinosa]|uniref:Glycine-rich protein n=1 Tax=Rehmannia glutinosa TaxID=99300 RepID=A0ABR0WWH0_REHGL